jgi:uncharacterized membrane protein YbhN (UPF0104 family)
MAISVKAFSALLRSHRTARNRRLLWCVAWGVTSIAVVWSARSVDFAAAWKLMVSAHVGWILLGLAGNFAALPLLTTQWRRLLPRSRPISWAVVWECVTISVAGMNTLPFGGGHAIAVGMLATRGAGGVEGAVSLMALEQLCEGFSKMALLLVVLLTTSLPFALQGIAWATAGSLLVGFGVLVWLARHPTHGPAIGWRSRWARHLEVIQRPRVLLATVALSLAMKVTTLFAMYAVQRSLGVNLSWASAPLVLAVVTFATMVSVTPANVGVYEAAAFGVYRLLGVPPDMALALGLLQHACLVIPLVGTGYLVTVWRTLVPALPAVESSPTKL